MDKRVGQGIRFERIRRITGYLVGDMRKFNDAKCAEVRDRVKHLGTLPDSTKSETQSPEN